MSTKKVFIVVDQWAEKNPPLFRCLLKMNMIKEYKLIQTSSMSSDNFKIHKVKGDFLLYQDEKFKNREILMIDAPGLNYSHKTILKIKYIALKECLYIIEVCFLMSYSHEVRMLDEKILSLKISMLSSA